MTDPDSAREAERKRFLRSYYSFVLHLFCLALYLLPILAPSEFHKDTPVLDELHICSPENRDVNGETTLRQIFSNDYWGRPMDSPSSHKSWRPLTILSFRYLKGGSLLKDLTAHRIMNVMTHAATADLVGHLATLVVPNHGMLQWLHPTAKLVFALQSTHVEVTANAANRPHLLATLCGVLLANPYSSWWVFLPTLCCGYLCAETFLFQLVPILVTIVVICRVRKRQLPWFRLVLVAMSAGVYYGARRYFDTLSIPDGLIRPAENPFYGFEGMHRARNYLYVLSVHVLKAWNLDLLGFSHEYGFECIRAIESWTDPRMLAPLGIGLIYVTTGLVVLFRKSKVPLCLYLFHVSWMATLFPIAGIVKVGTFIADRIAVASTVSTSVLTAYWIAQWISDRKQWKLLILVVIGSIQVRRVHYRTLEWMNSLPLLESSLRTCPRFAKAHVEISKVYSGLYPSKLNLTKSRWHLEQAEEIDPDYCDVNQQFAHIAIQERKYSEFEERLTKSLLCQFTMSGSLDLWRRYWSMATDTTSNPPDVVDAAQKRYDKYMGIINEHIQREESLAAATP